MTLSSSYAVMIDVLRIPESAAVLSPQTMRGAHRESRTDRVNLLDFFCSFHFQPLHHASR